MFEQNYTGSVNSLFQKFTGTYRYGFNGKEKIDEVTGSEGATYDYGFRIYDSRLCRFLSVDPITTDFPELTPYQFASNRVIDGNDLDGLEFNPVKSDILLSQSITKIAKKTSNVIIECIAAPLNFVSYMNTAGNAKKPEVKKENEQKAGEAFCETLINFAISYGVSKAIGGAAKYFAKSSLNRSLVRDATKVNTEYISKNPTHYTPWRTGSKVIETTIKNDINLVRLSGLNNVEGSWYTTLDEIQGLTAAEMKSKFGLKYEPTQITPVTIKAGAKIRIGEAGEVKKFNADGGGLQIEKISGKSVFGKTESIGTYTKKANAVNQ